MEKTPISNMGRAIYDGFGVKRNIYYGRLGAPTMYESAASLQDVCLNYICENISAVCAVHTSLDTGHTSLTFKNGEIFYPALLADHLLSSLSEMRKLTDETMALFNSNNTSLRRVRLKNCPVTTKGLRVLKSHKISDIEAIGLRRVTVNDLICSLGEWTLNNLRTLNVSNSTFMDGSQFCVVVSLSKLHNLKSLNVSSTEFNNHGLQIITQDLPNLESLDISCTSVDDLSPLRKLKYKLKSLSMYNLRPPPNDEIVHVLCELKELRHLDVSDDFSVQPFHNLQPIKFRIKDFLIKARLPHLSSLDISGKDGVNESLLANFLNCHPNITFLGLALIESCNLEMFTDQQSSSYRQNLDVTGEASEKQIVGALKRYSNRAVYVQRSLYHLFTITQTYDAPRVDIVKFILPVMKAHPKELGVQMAATACLYNLTKSQLGGKIHPKWLAKVVNLTLAAMENFPNHQQLQKNALLTLCSDRILQEVTFDRYRCAHLVMECLCLFDDQSMNRMSVAICGILAAKIPTEQTSLLGAKAKNMQKLLAIVKDKTESATMDITMKFTLSALWNLTDESPSTCEMFLSEGGLDLFLKVLDVYKTTENPEDRLQVETKVLGLINNLAEVKMLRHRLMKEELIKVVLELLKSDKIDVSYFAAGIVSHVMSDGKASWTITGVSRDYVLDCLGRTVSSWKQPKGEMVAYRSFSPFFPLLTQFTDPEVQLWAVWAIQHVCTKHDERYCPMLISEGGAAMLEALSNNTDTIPQVAELVRNVLDMVYKNTRSPGAAGDGAVSSV